MIKLNYLYIVLCVCLSVLPGTTRRWGPVCENDDNARWSRIVEAVEIKMAASGRGPIVRAAKSPEWCGLSLPARYRTQSGTITPGENFQRIRMDTFS